MGDTHYKATIVWDRGDQVFTDKKFSRAHELRFDAGLVVPGSPAPSVVPPPMSREDAVDPEEGLVAAASSCHMLFFLALAAIKGFRVDRYEDPAYGLMSKNEKGKLFVSKIVLAPQITWSGDTLPEAADIERLHHRAHEECYIANSIRAEVVVEDIEPVFA